MEKPSKNSKRPYEITAWAASSHNPGNGINIKEYQVARSGKQAINLVKEKLRTFFQNVPKLHLFLAKATEISWDEFKQIKKSTFVPNSALRKSNS